MQIPIASNTGYYGIKAATNERIKAGVKQAGKDLVESYIGSSKEENIGSKGVAAAVGAAKSGTTAKAAQKTAIEAAIKRTEKSAIRKATTKVVVKAASKGAIKAVGLIGFVPDAITAVKGFIKGYSAYGN